MFDGFKRITVVKLVLRHNMKDSELFISIAKQNKVDSKACINGVTVVVGGRRCSVVCVQIN